MGVALQYTVLAGDTLNQIANSLNACAGISYQAIEQANPEINPATLSPGQILAIPSLQTGQTALKYTVLPGDSFYQIANNLSLCSGVTVQAIEHANPDVVPTLILPGQLLNIPSTGNSDQPVVDATYIGYWNWTWSPGIAPASTNMGIAFSGWTDPATALQQSAEVKNTLVGQKYICLGGGNENGAFNSDRLNAITAAIQAGQFVGYDGIAYDVEEGTPGLATLFKQSFAAAKTNLFKVLVTVSHSAPYGINDAASLMQSFFEDGNIDFLSPQLYTTGSELSNDYDISADVHWSAYANAKAVIIPSIVKASMYTSAQTYFQEQGVTLNGFVQWSSQR